MIITHEIIKQMTVEDLRKARVLISNEIDERKIDRFRELRSNFIKSYEKLYEEFPDAILMINAHCEHCHNLIEINLLKNHPIAMKQLTLE